MVFGMTWHQIWRRIRDQRPWKPHNEKKIWKIWKKNFRVKNPWAGHTQVARVAPDLKMDAGFGFPDPENPIIKKKFVKIGKKIFYIARAGLYYYQSSIIEGGFGHLATVALPPLPSPPTPVTIYQSQWPQFWVHIRNQRPRKPPGGHFWPLKPIFNVSGQKPGPGGPWVAPTPDLTPDSCSARQRGFNSRSHDLFWS